MGVNTHEVLDLLNKKRTLLQEIFDKTDEFCQDHSENSVMGKFVDAYNLLYKQRAELFNELAKLQDRLKALVEIKETNAETALVIAKNDELITKIIELDKEAIELGNHFGVELKAQIKSMNDSKSITLAYNKNYQNSDGYLLDKKN